MLLPAVVPLLLPAASPVQGNLRRPPLVSAATIPPLSKIDRRKLFQAALPTMTIGENLAEPTVLRWTNSGNSNESLLVTGVVMFTNEKGGVAHLMDLTSAGQGTGELRATFRATKGATYALLVVGRSTISSAAYTYASGTDVWGTGQVTINPNSTGFVVGVTAKGTGPVTLELSPLNGKTYGAYCEIQRIEITRL